MSNGKSQSPYREATQILHSFIEKKNQEVPQTSFSKICCFKILVVND